MNALERDYVTKRAEYDSLIDLNDPSKLPDIQALNTELSKILHSMLEEVSKVKGSAEKLRPYRDELIQKLVKIQNESSIMLKQRDQYETLRALQTHEKTKFDSTLFWYMISLGIVTLIFIIVLIWKGGYKLPTIPTTTSSATTMPALT
jgi:hypothetical protein